MKCHRGSGETSIPILIEASLRAPHPPPPLCTSYGMVRRARYIDSRVTPETSHRKRFPEALFPPPPSPSTDRIIVEGNARASERDLVTSYLTLSSSYGSGVAANKYDITLEHRRGQPPALSTPSYSYLLANCLAIFRRCF